MEEDDVRNNVYYYVSGFFPGIFLHFLFKKASIFLFTTQGKLFYCYLILKIFINNNI